MSGTSIAFAIVVDEYKVHTHARLLTSATVTQLNRGRDLRSKVV